MSRLFLPVLLFWIALSAPAQVVVSEIHYHPVEEPVFAADGSPVIDLTDDVHEFIELQNAGGSPVSLAGWRLDSGADFVIPAGTTIPPGGFRVIAKNPARIESVYALPAGSVLGPFTGKLGNDGDTIRIKDAAGATVEEVSYSGHFPWAESANALGVQDRFTGLNAASFNYKGRSLQRVSVSANANDPANWLASPITGPTPGAAQAVTRSIPKPVVVAHSRVQTSDGAAIVRAGQPVTVNATFSSAQSLSQVQVEWFADDVNSSTETRTGVTMTALGNGIFTASLPAQPDRSIVRYRFRANRGDGMETVSPRADDPQIAPTGAGGALEAWHGYFVTPANRTGATYDILMSNSGVTQISTNITQSPRRVTAANASGLPREVPYVAATAPIWNGTMPAVFASGGEVRDIHVRYHGSRYQRSAAARSYKIHFPENQPFRGITSFFVTDKTVHTAEVQKLMRLLDLPSGLTRNVTLFFNNDAGISRLEHGEFERHVLEEWAERQAALNPGAPEPDTGEFYKASGNIDGSQNNLEGPYTKGDQAPMLPNAGWNQVQRYSYTYPIQNHAWKGHRQLRDMVEGMWTARGDTPQANSLAGSPAAIAATRAWFSANFDMDSTLTALALAQWMGAWDDTGHNQIFWRKADGRWVRLPYDFDQVIVASRATQSIYSNEVGVNTFNGPNWWKDTIFKCFRNEFKQRLWELNNTAFDPVQLTANNLTTASAFAAQRQANVNTQVALGTFTKPARPSNTSPANTAGIVGGAALTGSTYSHPAARPHAASRWEIRTAAGEFEDPLIRVTSTTALTSFPVPFDQLTWGQTYSWRVTYYDADGHASIVSVETAFTYGTASAGAGDLVLNEILADNRSAAENGGSYPDFIELRNNSASAATLDGLALTDDPLVPAKFVFPAGTTLTAGASMVVWCDNAATAPGLHTGFGLSASGQTVLLLNGTAILDSVTFGPQAADVSIGRIVNGTGGWQANAPSPGAPNTARTLGSTTALRFNEWMASPAYGDDWFELYNADANPVALGSLYLSDDPGEPLKTQVPPLSFIGGRGFTKFVADNSAAGAHHANFRLGGGGDNLVLTPPQGTGTLDLITFGAQTQDVSEGRLVDGGGPVVSFPGSSSPAGSNWLPAPIVINEALANSTAPFTDSIELHNPTAAPVSIGGWWLSDDRSTPQKFQIPAGTTIATGGYAVFTEAQFGAGAVPFLLSSSGDEIILSAVDGGGALTGYRAEEKFGASAENVSFGRVAVAGGSEFWPLTAPTFATVNAAPKTLPLVINEIHYHPTDTAGGADNSSDEFIEIYNPGTIVDVSNWRLNGDSDFTFPAGSSIAAGGYALLTGFDPANTAMLDAFRAHHGIAATIPVFGPYSPKLSNSTQTVELAYPGSVAATEVPFINVDKVDYRDLAPWDAGADGTGLSLQRESRTLIGNDPANWTAAPPTPGAVNSGVLTELLIASESTLPGGVAGVSYGQSLVATGGTVPYAWAVTGGALPGGVTLTPDGSLTGTPASASTFSFTAQVTDNSGDVETKSFTLTIAATAVEITTASLPDGAFGTAYSQTLSATGGNPAYSWSLSGGALPAGLSLSTAGIITGTPAASGTYHFSVRATDTGALAAVRSLSIFIPVPPLTILSTSPLPVATHGAVYAQQLLAAGGTGPYAWTLSGGALPGGVTLSSAGDLGGTPAVPGTFHFTVQLTDASAVVRARDFTLTVLPQPLVVTTGATLPGGIVGDAYALTLAATGGTLPYSWTVTTGELPPGLSLSSGGVLGGTPAESGSFSFVVQNADNGAQAVTKSFALDIAASGPLDHFTWDYVPAAANAGTPFAARITARDAQQRLVTSWSGSATVTGARGGGTLPAPVVITEVTNEAEDQFELQNVSDSTVDTTGWFVRLGDSSASINFLNTATFALPNSLPPGAIVRVSEMNVAGRSFFGAPINWNTTTPRGWIMLFDSATNLRDFFAIGWTAGEIGSLSAVVNGRTITPAGQWSGAGASQGTIGNLTSTTDSWTRQGSTDSNSTSGWTWLTNGQTLGTTNAALTLPWTVDTPVSVTPAAMTFTGGEAVGYLTVTQPATAVRLTATAGVTWGMSASFDVFSSLVDTDADGIPDTYETAHGLNPNAGDAALDSDHDGSSNGDEFSFGTDPQIGGSVPAITSVALTADGELSVSWPAAAGKLYRIATSTNALVWDYTPVLATVTAMQTAVIMTQPQPRLFVKIDVAP